MPVLRPSNSFSAFRTELLAIHRLASMHLIHYKEPTHAPVAQLDRAPDYESVGRGFESLLAYQ
jgi:hypothetical protein